MLQFSGAIWFPMVYELPKRAKQALGKQKRDRQFDRTLRYIDDLKADWVFPMAGPPCFLDEELWGFNDIYGDEANIFPDQMVFADWMAEQGRDNVRVLLPGSASRAGPARLPGHAFSVRRRDPPDLPGQGDLPTGLPGTSAAGRRGPEGILAASRDRPAR